MITILYLVLLVSFVILEKFISDTAQYRGLLLAIGVAISGFFLSDKMIWLGLIIACINIGRFALLELSLLRLTSLKERLSNVLDFQARFN